jgi:hypothetical protein
MTMVEPWFPNGEDSIVATFDYTTWGAPKEITVTHRQTGNPDYHFHYDQFNRLIAFEEDYGIAFERYYKYVYNNGKIVSDTVFQNGYKPEYPDIHYALGYYKYDSYNRVIEYRYVDTLWRLTKHRNTTMQTRTLTLITNLFRVRIRS